MRQARVSYSGSVQDYLFSPGRVDGICSLVRRFLESSANGFAEYL